MQWKLRHDRALVEDRHVVAPRQFDEEARAVERQLEKNHVALADPPRRRPAAPRRTIVEADREIVLIADLQRAPGLIADHDVAIAVLLIDADPQHGALRIAAKEEAAETEAGVDTDLPLADGSPQLRVLSERGGRREATQAARQQQQPAQHSCPHSRNDRTQASMAAFSAVVRCLCGTFSLACNA
jgi:hypothetical protein